MARDYKSYDYIAFTVKRSAEEELLAAYERFTWEPEERVERKKTVDLLLRRPHKIPHKDRLQLLQVNMEKSAENLVKYTQYRFSAVRTIAFYFCFFCLAVVAAGLSLAATGGNALIISLGTVGATAGLAALIASAAVLRRDARRERAFAVSRMKEAAQEIKRACGEAEELINGA